MIKIIQSLLCIEIYKVLSAQPAADDNENLQNMFKGKNKGGAGAAGGDKQAQGSTTASNGSQATTTGKSVSMKLDPKKEKNGKEKGKKSGCCK